jgi:hypothetical protein
MALFDYWGLMTLHKLAVTIVANLCRHLLLLHRHHYFCCCCYHGHFPQAKPAIFLPLLRFRNAVLGEFFLRRLTGMDNPG